MNTKPDFAGNGQDTRPTLPQKSKRSVLTLALIVAALGGAAQPADHLSVSKPFISERGPHHRSWVHVVQMPGPNGRPISQVRSAYIELGSGMHRKEGNAWVECSPDFELFGGGAVARRTQHRLILSPSIADSPAIDMEGSGGTRLRSRIFGLAYRCAATGRTVLLAEIKDSIGELVAPDTVLYADCFTDDVNADVRCVNRLSGIEVDVILRQQLPDPREWDILPENCRVQVWTAFQEPPAAKRQQSIIHSETDLLVRAAMREPDFVDEVVAFSDLHFTHGKAFTIESEMIQAAGIDVDKTVTVGKQWAVVQNSTYLIESCDYTSIKPFLDSLPVAANKGPENKNLAGARKRKAVSSSEELIASVPKPEKKRASSASPGTNRLGAASSTASNRAIQVASARSPRPGFLIDYSTLNSSLTNYTFSSVDTYYISAPVTLYGNSNVAMGLSVVKFAPTNNARIDVKGKLTFDTDIYRPFVLTARDYHNIGEKIGNASLSGKYANIALRFDYNTTNILAAVTNVRIMYASKALEFAGGDGHDVRHVQFIDCGTAVHVDGGRVAIRNALGWNLTNALTGANSGTSTGLWEHATFDSTTNLVTTATGWFTNCLLAGVVTTNGLDGAGNSVVSSPSGLFTVVGSGSHYLASGSPYRDAGVSTIQPQLASELAQRTTYPPLVLTNTIAVSTTLSPQAGRDNNTPDIGWHSPPLDWWSGGVTIANATLTLTNGVAVGMDYISNSWGFILNSANLISAGIPTLYNRLLRADTAQEKSGGNPGTRACFYDGTSSAACELRMRFTEFAQLANGGYMVYTGTNFSALEWTHSRIFNPWLVVDTSGSFSLVCGLTNSLWERGDIYFGSGSTPSTVKLHARNNLFRYETITLQGKTNWSVRDNLFDHMSGMSDSSIQVSNSQNAYFNTSYGFGGGITNTNLASLVYQAGPLGRYYQQTNSILIGFGSQNATNAGLFHFCVTTNQVKETNSVVDVGLHYVAVDANGQPLDSDSDGTPDYLEDINGNGVVASGERDWQSGGDGGFRVFITRPRNGSNIP